MLPEKSECFNTLHIPGWPISSRLFHTLTILQPPVSMCPSLDGLVGSPQVVLVGHAAVVSTAEERVTAILPERLTSIISI